MSLNPEPLRLYKQRLTAMIAALRLHPETIVKGRACALGTLTAMLNRVNKLIDAWESRAMTKADRKEVVQDASTLRWLKAEKWVSDDFEGEYFDLPEAASTLSFSQAMDVLISCQQDAVAESA
ncbi:hypothetical protein [Asticcacaulis sp. YBE204]|uniref:hypothetical protein n=1 Tax=Asticcacaulis sp. YBE204 TaxID=1282363 RepID=UPI000413D0FA|nr:hypothetical protein [Asticcacaulis sp. YBE204]